MRRGEPEFAVVDVETTGLHPGWHDRVCEVAVVRMSADGTVLDEYCTLVNPDRDLGPTDIHGLRAGDVLDAPRFEEIAGAVTRLLDGAIFTAHNVAFDARFIDAELERIGCTPPDYPRLCTMRLAAAADPAAPSRRLDDLCAHFGVALEDHHSAQSDARAAAALLMRCLDRVGGIAVLMDAADTSLGCRWPSLPVASAPLLREQAARARRAPSSFIAELVARLPRAADAAHETEAYLALLDRALEDRRVTGGEAEQLISLAEMAGLSWPEAAAAHERYLDELVRLALADGVVSEAERADIEDVRRLLGIQPQRLEEMTSVARATPPALDTASGGECLDGQKVCFTGALTCTIDGSPIDRTLATRLAQGAGMIIRTGVSRKLDVLVLADPDSMSSKAKKARALGVRLVAEPVFWRMLGVRVD